MDEKATQDARLDCLVEEFKADPVQYEGDTERAHGVNLLMFPYFLIIPARFNSFLAHAVAGAAESLRQTTIRPISQEEAA